MPVGKWWGIFRHVSRGDKKYYASAIWEIIGTGITINLFDNLGILGFLAKPRTVQEISSQLPEGIPMHYITDLLEILSTRGYLRKSPDGKYQINTDAIDKLMRTLSRYPFTEFTPLIKASEKFFADYLKELSNKESVDIHDPKLALIFYNVLKKDFVERQRESLILWVGGKKRFFQKDILNIFSGFGQDARSLIEHIGYNNIKRLVIGERDKNTIEIAKRIKVKINGEEELLGNLDKVEFVILGNEAEKIEEFDPNSFDIAISFMQILIISNIEQLAKNVYNILRPKGLFIGSSPFKVREDLPSIFDIIGKLIGWKGFCGEDYFKNVLKKAGFKKADIYISYFFRAEK